MRWVFVGTLGRERLTRIARGMLGVALSACLSTGEPAPTATPAVSAAPVRTLRVLVTALSETGAAGAPLSGARACAAPARGEERCVETGADGVAALSLAPSTYLVRVEGPERARWWPEQRAVDVAGGDAALWVGVAGRVRISGRISDEEGGAIARAEACAYPYTEDLPVCARSGADGGYVIEARAGFYRLHVDGPPGGRLVSQWARGRPFLESADTLDARQADVPDVDVALARGVVLRGTVRLASATLEDAQVCTKTLAAPLPWECERTDKFGAYGVLRVPGRYWVWVVPPDRVRAVAQWYDRVLVGFDASPLTLDADRTLDVTLEPGPQIRGRVITERGEPVPDALVCVDTPFTTNRICRPSGYDGSYAVTTRPETYIVNVIPPESSDFVAEYWSEKRNWTEADRVRLGSADLELDLTLVRGVQVHGTVKDRRGIPVTGATLNLNDERGVAAAGTTDAAGNFRVTVRSGRYRLEVFPPFIVNLIGRELDIDASGSVELDVVLEDVAP